MKKIFSIILVVVSFLACLPPVFANDTWKFIDGDSEINVYLNVNDIIVEGGKIDNKDTIFATAKFLHMIAPEFKDSDSQNPAGLTDLSYKIIIDRFDKENRRVMLLGIDYYNSNHVLLRSAYAKNPKWRDIVQGSNGENFYNKVFEYVDIR